MKKIFLLILIISTTLSSISQSDKYNKLVTDFVSSPELRNAGISIYAESTSSNKTILDYNSDLSLVPASTFKIIPTAITLETFGHDHRFKTELAYSGTISNNGTLNGNIYIIGHGDPCLGSSNFTQHYNKGQLLEQWVTEIKKLGIKTINGGIIADISYFGEINIPNKWIWEDIGNYYGSQGSSLNYLDNSYKVHFSTGSTDGSPAEIIKVIPEDLDITFTNRVTSSSVTGDEAYIYMGSNESERIIRGTLPWKKSDYAIKGSIPNPELYLAKTFSNILNKSGIKVYDKPMVISTSDKISRNVFHTTYSPTLFEIISQTNMKSINLYAEILSYHIVNSTGKTYKESVIDFFKSSSINTEGLNIEDASGLSHFNTATSKQLALFLKNIKSYSSQSKYFINSLPVAGISGTVASYSSNLKDKLKVKSGSMTRVRAYAGFLYTNSGEEIVFCIIINNYNCNGYKMRKLFEDFFHNIIEI